MPKTYPRPPITEAVIEMRVAGPIRRELLDRVQKRALVDYPFSEELESLGVLLEMPNSAATVKHDWNGYKMSTVERSRFLSIGPTTFNVSRLAPYPGWEVFRGEAREQWDQWKRIVGYQKIVRVGVRYINRIDFLLNDTGRVEVEDFLNFHLTLPTFLDHQAMTAFVTQARVPLGADECDVMLNSTATPSPLVKHGSFILDIDIYRERNPPQSDDDVWALIERIRGHKNEIFESSITDRARDLFSK